MNFLLTNFINYAHDKGCHLSPDHIDVIAELELHRLHHGGGRIIINQEIFSLELPHLITLYFHWLNSFVYPKIELHSAVIAPNVRPLRQLFSNREQRTIHFADSRTPFALRSQPLHFALIYNADRFDSRPFREDHIGRPRFIHFLSSALAALPIVSTPVHINLANRHYPHAPVSMMVVLANLNRRRLPAYLKPYLQTTNTNWVSLHPVQAVAHQQKIRELKRKKARGPSKRRAGCPNLRQTPPWRAGCLNLRLTSPWRAGCPNLRLYPPSSPQFTHYPLSTTNYHHAVA